MVGVSAQRAFQTIQGRGEEAGHGAQEDGRERDRRQLVHEQGEPEHEQEDAQDGHAAPGRPLEGLPPHAVGG